MFGPTRKRFVAPAENWATAPSNAFQRRYNLSAGESLQHWIILLLTRHYVDCPNPRYSTPSRHVAPPDVVHVQPAHACALLHIRRVVLFLSPDRTRPSCQQRNSR